MMKPSSQSLKLVIRNTVSTSFNPLPNKWVTPSSRPMLNPPSSFREVAAPLIKKIPFLSGADGREARARKGEAFIMVSKFQQNKVRYADIYKEATRPFTNHPGRCAASPPLNGGEWTRLESNP